MKHKILLISLITLLLLITVSAGYTYLSNYSLLWWTVDGGGGTSNSAQYSLSGTIGQPDAGNLTGGDYILTGGFWGGVQQSGGQFFLPVIVR
jgi:hypothetical protein